MTGQTCKNCEQTLPGDAAYCSACGQSLRRITRPWLEASKEVAEELFDVDGRMLRSFRYLLSRPGFLSHEYINGHRVAYTSPVRMYLVVSLLFFLVLPLILPERTDFTNEDHNFSADLYSKAMFLLLPVFSLLLKLFYRRSYYLAHLVFTAYLFSAMFIGFAALMSIETAADRYLMVFALQFVIFMAMGYYVVAALRKTYGESWAKSTLKFFGLLLAFLPVLAISIELASHVPVNAG